MAKADEKPEPEAKPKCFIIMPISVPDHLLETYAGDKNHFDDVLKHLFEPAVKLAGFDPIRPSSDGSKVIHRDIAEKLQNTEMVLCDMSALNPNVFFELGIRTAMNKPICLVTDTSLPKLPFDTGVIQCHPYNSTPGWGLDAQRTKLAGHLTATAKSTEYKNGKNAWWQVMGVDYAPASIEPGGNPTDLNHLKLDQIISMLDTTRTSETPATRQISNKGAIKRLSRVLPPDVTEYEWQTPGPGRLTLNFFQDVPMPIVEKLSMIAEAIGVELVIHCYLFGDSEDIHTEPTDQ